MAVQVLVESLRATEWSYDNDLNAPPARFRVKFLESSSASSFLPGEARNIRGLQSINIDVVVNGAMDRLMTGVVRYWGVEETDTAVLSTAEGIDLKATVLDFWPSAPRAFRGMELLSDSFGIPLGQNGAVIPITSFPQGAVPDGAIATIQLGSNSVGNPVIAAFFDSFQNVARQVVANIGYSAFFDCQDYMLGRDVVWEPDRTAADIITELVHPFNQTERYRLDVTIEGGVVKFVERGHSAPPAASVDYIEFTKRTLRKYTPPSVNDVQVLGAAYRFREPNVPLFFSEGAPGGGAVEYREVLKESPNIPPTFPAGTPVVVGEITGIRYHDSAGRVTQHSKVERRTAYIVHQGLAVAGSTLVPASNQGIGQVFPADRTVTTVETTDFAFPGPQGQEADVVMTEYVTDNSQLFHWDPATASFLPYAFPNAVSQWTKRKEIHQEFDANGDVTMRIERTWAAVEPKWNKVPGVDATGKAVIAPDTVIPPDPSGVGASFPGQFPTDLQMTQEIEQHFYWSGGMRWRMTTNKSFSPFNSLVPEKTTVSTEPATGRGKAARTPLFRISDLGTIGIWQAGKITQFGPTQELHAQGNVRLAHAQVKAGPDNAQIKLNLPLIGNPADAQYFRSKKLSELQSVRNEVTLEGVPDLNVKPGYQLTVAGAPQRWQVSSFFVVGRNMRHQPTSMIMTLKGLAWTSV